MPSKNYKTSSSLSLASDYLQYVFKLTLSANRKTFLPNYPKYFLNVFVGKVARPSDLQFRNYIQKVLLARMLTSQF